MSGPIYEIRKSYLKAKADNILARVSKESSYITVETFKSADQMNRILELLVTTSEFCERFNFHTYDHYDAFVLGGKSFLIITPVREDSLTQYRTRDQVVARITELAQNGISKCAEICKSPSKAKKLSKALSDMIFYCQTYDNIVVIRWW